jgi:hypothetical protein
MKLLRALLIGLSITSLAHAGSGLESVLTQEGREVLEHADSFEVLSLECERAPAPGEDAIASGSARFGRYPVTKRVVIADAETRRAIVDAALRSTRGADMMAGCFEPHHAVIARKGNQQVVLVICFQCLQIEVTAPEVGCLTICTRKSPLVQTLNPLLGLAAPPVGVFEVERPGLWLGALLAIGLGVGSGLLVIKRLRWRKREGASPGGTAAGEAPPPA